MDLDTLLADAAPARLASLEGPDSPAAVSLYQQIAAQPPAAAPAFRRHRLPVPAAAVAVACAAALVIVAWSLGGAPKGPIATKERPLGALAGQPARHFLLAMAMTAARAPLTTGRYWCTQAMTAELAPVGPDGVELTPPGQGLPASPPSAYRYSIIDRQRMVNCLEPARPGSGTVAGSYQELGAKPATPEDAAAWRRAGSPRWRAWYRGGQVIPRRPRPRQRTGPKPGQEPWGNDASLPANPAKLRAALLAHPISFSRNTNENLFVSARVLLLDPVRPAVRAAAFQVLAGIKGVQMKPGVKDPQGRAGTAVWLGRPGLVIIVDPATGTLLADEWLAGQHGWVYAPGTVSQYTVWLRVGWANHLPTYQGAH